MSLKMGVRHLPWCGGKYPYEDVCWAASEERILIPDDCEGCDLMKGRIRIKAKGGKHGNEGN